MQQLVPWSAFIALTEPPYSSSGRVGRTHIGVARMLHMYFLQQWNSLIDEGLQDAVHGQPSCALTRWASTWHARA